MFKIGLLLLLAAVCSSSSADDCSKSAGDVFTRRNGLDFIDMKDGCVNLTETQIKYEITASMKYMAMAAYFARDSVNRPGFAKLFFDAAGEEREHAYKLIEYLSMRGRYLSNADPTSSLSLENGLLNLNIADLVKGAGDLQVQINGKTITLEDISKDTDSSGLAALKNALKLEIAVTKSIRNLITKCEDDEAFNHFHFVDVLTGDFLDEQYKGQRDLAGKVSTLEKMVKGHGSKLAEFLFDKQLL